MAEHLSSGAPWPAPADVAARLDRLEQRLAELEDLRPTVESALVAQAARIETVLGGVHRDLSEAAAAQVEATRQVVQQLAERMAGVQASVGDGLTAVTEVLAEQHRAATADHTALGEQAEADAERLRVRLREAAAAALDDVRTVAERAVDDVAARLEAAGARMEAAATTVASLESALGEHLTQLDRRAAVERAQLTHAFAEQVADGLTRRERRRLAKRLEVPDPTTAPPPVPGPASSPRPVSRSAGVQPSRRTRPVRRTASDPQDPAAIRRSLAAVRGLGPARQSALIDRFGSLEAIRAATDEDLLGVPGIGAALLPGIRDAVD